MKQHTRNRKPNPNSLFQDYEGIRYYLSEGEKYYRGKHRRLHVVVWEQHNGPAPKGHHVHHKDEDKSNNTIQNLELKAASAHMKGHGVLAAYAKTPEGKAHNVAARQATKEWHSSEAGREWHRQHAVAMGFGSRTFGVVACSQCQKPFTKKTSNAALCSNNCKSKHRKASGVDDVTETCSICHTLFTRNKYVKQSTCSRPCGAHLRNANRAIFAA